MPEVPSQLPCGSGATAQEGLAVARAMPEGVPRVCLDGSGALVLRVVLDVRLPTPDVMRLISQYHRQHFASAPASSAASPAKAPASCAGGPESLGSLVQGNRGAPDWGLLRSFQDGASVTQDVGISEMRGICALNLEPGILRKFRVGASVTQVVGKRSQGMKAWGLSQRLNLRPLGLARASPSP